MNEEKYWKMPDWIQMNMISKEGAFIMAKVFITLTGTKHYFGNDFLEKFIEAIDTNGQVTTLISLRSL